MAISRDKKTALVTEFSTILANSKMTVGASYNGTSVADLQTLRRQAREQGVEIKVIKNRLVRAAMRQSQGFEKTDTDLLVGQLIYAYSFDDEVAPAQVLDKFSQSVPSINLVVGFDSTGTMLDTLEVKALANLPSKPQLIAQVVAQLISPLHDVTNALSGNLHSLLDGIEAKAV